MPPSIGVDGRVALLCIDYGILAGHRALGMILAVGHEIDTVIADQPQAGRDFTGIDVFLPCPLTLGGVGLAILRIAALFEGCPALSRSNAMAQELENACAIEMEFHGRPQTG